MSLRSDYFDGATGLQTQMGNAFTAGVTYVSTNQSALSAGLISSAAQGQTTFTINIAGTGSLNATYLRANNGNNLLLKSFLAGIKNGLASQLIYEYECNPTLNIASPTATSIDFNFTFQTS